jgi:hypothetical protein
VRLIALDDADLPVADLTSGDFVAVSGDRQVSVLQADYQPGVTASKTFVIVVGEFASTVESRRAQSVLKLLADLIRPADQLELILCSSGLDAPRHFEKAGSELLRNTALQPSFDHAPLTGAIRAGLEDLGSSRNAALIAIETGDSGLEQSDGLAATLSSAHVALHVVQFPSKSGDPVLLRQLALDSGGTWVDARSNQPDRLRAQLSGPVAGDGTYLLTLEGSLKSTPVVALASQMVAPTRQEAGPQ